MSCGSFTRGAKRQVCFCLNIAKSCAFTLQLVDKRTGPRGEVPDQQSQIFPSEAESRKRRIEQDQVEERHHRVWRHRYRWVPRRWFNNIRNGFKGARSRKHWNFWKIVWENEHNQERKNVVLFGLLCRIWGNNQKKEIKNGWDDCYEKKTERSDHLSFDSTILTLISFLTLYRSPAEEEDGAGDDIEEKREPVADGATDAEEPTAGEGEETIPMDIPPMPGAVFKDYLGRASLATGCCATAIQAANMSHTDVIIVVIVVAVLDRVLPYPFLNTTSIKMSKSSAHLLLKCTQDVTFSRPGRWFALLFVKGLGEGKRNQTQMRSHCALPPQWYSSLWSCQHLAFVRLMNEIFFDSHNLQNRFWRRSWSEEERTTEGEREGRWVHRGRNVTVRCCWIRYTVSPFSLL